MHQYRILDFRNFSDACQIMVKQIWGSYQQSYVTFIYEKYMYSICNFHQFSFELASSKIEEFKKKCVVTVCSWRTLT
jgi:hypothetical protein